MEHTKLYHVVAQFNKYEQNRCRKFVQSPYFNRSEALEVLFEEISRHINGEKKASVEKEALWKKAHPGKEYDDVRFRKYVSDLLKLVESYLAQEQYESQQLHQTNQLLSGLGDRKFDQLVSGALRKAGRLTETAPHKSAAYFYQQYAFENNKYRLLYQDRHGSERTNITDISSCLDYFYMAEKIRIKCAALSRQYDEGDHKYELLFIDDIIQHVAQNEPHYEDIPPVIIYYYIYKSMSEVDQPDHYFRLRTLLDRHGLQFRREEAFWLYTFAINYCVRRINQGKSEFLREYFMLYQDLLKKELIIIDGELAIGHFRNVVTVGLRLGEIKWTESFILKHKQYLPEIHRENAVTFNLAQLYFYQKEYDKVIETLQFVEYNDLSYNLRSKTFLLMTYYEQDEIEPLYSLMDSFRAYLGRHQNIPPRRKKMYQDLIRSTKKLSRIIPGDKVAIEKFKKELEGMKSMASYQWVQEKIAELEV
ncbi:MAG: hypothetical protein KDC34_07960 [Saprospiraceae bacterium]|nr:hypothetical protein [Saprospiraceae bacterium]